MSFLTPRLLAGDYPLVNKLLRDVHDLETRCTDLKASVVALEAVVKEQQSFIEEQRELLTALWHCPGMPGATEAKEDFKNHVEKLEN